jgi:hypothetical protein
MTGQSRNFIYIDGREVEKIKEGGRFDKGRLEVHFIPSWKDYANKFTILDLLI